MYRRLLVILLILIISKFNYSEASEIEVRNQYFNFKVLNYLLGNNDFRPIDVFLYDIDEHMSYKTDYEIPIPVGVVVVVLYPPDRNN